MAELDVAAIGARIEARVEALRLAGVEQYPGDLLGAHIDIRALLDALADANAIIARVEAVHDPCEPDCSVCVLLRELRAALTTEASA